MKKFYLFATIIISVLTVPIVALVLIVGIWGSFYIRSIQSFYLLLIIVPIIYLLWSVYSFITVIRIKLKKIPVTKITQYLLSTFIVAGVIVFALSGYIVLTLFNESAPQLFPLDDKLATYTIEKKYGDYWIAYNTKSKANTRYICQLKGGCHNETENNMESFIATSPVDLAPFKGKNVILTGDFDYVNKQCIANHCKDGRIMGLVIKTIQEKK